MPFMLWKEKFISWKSHFYFPVTFLAAKHVSFTTTWHLVSQCGLSSSGDTQCLLLLSERAHLWWLTGPLPSLAKRATVAWVCSLPLPEQPLGNTGPLGKP